MNILNFAIDLINKDLFISVTGALVASYIFLLIAFKPKMKIAKKICKLYWSPDPSTTPTTPWYVFKIVNKSIFSAFNISVELNKIQTFETDGGTNVRRTPINIVSSHLTSIPPYRPFWCWWAKNAEYAMQFRTAENLEAILAEDTSKLRIQITCSHGLTGLSKVKRMEYAVESSIKSGRFKYGRNTEIV